MKTSRHREEKRPVQRHIVIEVDLGPAALEKTERYGLSSPFLFLRPRGLVDIFT